MGWIAECDTQGREFPTCVYVTKTTGTMTHVTTYVPIEDWRDERDKNAKLRELMYERAHVYAIQNMTEDELRVTATNVMAENAKLRKLCAQMVETVECSSSTKRCVLFSECAVGGYEPCLYEQELRELGVEVPDY